MLIKNCRLIPELSGGKAAEHGAIDIKDGVINGVFGDNEWENEAEGYDCSGMTVIPGLIDLHTHITCLSGVATECLGNEKQVMVEAAKQAKRYLQYGFTTIRDCGSAAGSADYVKQLTASGVIEGPEIISCGNILMPGIFNPDDSTSCLSLACDGVEEYRRNVRREVASGGDFIKIYASGSAMCKTGVPQNPIMTSDEIRTAVETAEANDLYVAAHCHADAAIKACIDNGVKTIEHATYLSEDSIDLLVMKEYTCLIPTMSAMFVSQTEPSERDFWLKRLTPMLKSCSGAMKKAYEAGVKIGFGTDSAPLSRQYSEGIEFRYRKEYCGFRDIDILIQATKGSAEIAGISDRKGEIKEGLSADLVLVDGKPDKDISAMYREPESVWKAGVKVK
jgi:imidazolonepropionase-like amidohydrolase